MPDIPTEQEILAASVMRRPVATPRCWRVMRGRERVGYDVIEADDLRVTEGGALVFWRSGIIIRAVAVGWWSWLEIVEDA